MTSKRYRKRTERGKKSDSKRRSFFYWRFRKAHPEKFTKPSSGFVKPLSKDEASAARKAGISDDEFRYEQACSWAILMGEQLPDKREFMANLAKRRAKK